MTTNNQAKRQRRLALVAAVVVGSVAQFGLIDSCNDELINITRFFDPCGTVLSNCAPGSFFSNNVEIGSREANCWDPTCSVPGLCGPDPPLGTVRDPCE